MRTAASIRFQLFSTLLFGWASAVHAAQPEVCPPQAKALYEQAKKLEYRPEGARALLSKEEKEIYRLYKEAYDGGCKLATGALAMATLSGYWFARKILYRKSIQRRGATCRFQQSSQATLARHVAPVERRDTFE